ncbi:unnamed protein product [Vitrella brassicaformis CCMP3155]|uniref:Uncharacterized protein n=1 Tax=Vitrella brassicaformis (strain CCMP3155) TaxID=1169540 RepID=A0A0G4F420_VITBC|nr:unnamed protein product [Vitrella brassicaformis CCMP3155]|eukprot:CEM06461.1 unnamed protein product [Vitrella brassicaformis CCMP3155]
MDLVQVQRGAVREPRTTSSSSTSSVPAEHRTLSPVTTPPATYRYSVAPSTSQEHLSTPNSRLRFCACESAAVCIKTAVHESGLIEPLMSHLLREQSLANPLRRHLLYGTTENEKAEERQSLYEPGRMSRRSSALFDRMLRGDRSFQEPARFDGLPFTPFLSAASPATSSSAITPTQSSAPAPFSPLPPSPPSYVLEGMQSGEFAMAAVKRSTISSLPTDVSERGGLPLDGLSAPKVDEVTQRRLRLEQQQRRSLRTFYIPWPLFPHTRRRRRFNWTTSIYRIADSEDDLPCRRSKVGEGKPQAVSDHFLPHTTSFCVYFPLLHHCIIDGHQLAAPSSVLRFGTVGQAAVCLKKENAEGLGGPQGRMAVVHNEALMQHMPAEAALSHPARAESSGGGTLRMWSVTTRPR